MCFLQVGKILKIPVIKFLLHSASYLWFLITLLGESITMEMYRDQFASRKQSILHSSFHMVWVVGGFRSDSFYESEIRKPVYHRSFVFVLCESPTGFFWYECKEVWIEGLRSYFLDWWNCLDMMVLSMYLASFSLRVLILLKGYFCQEQIKSDECVYFTETGEVFTSSLLPSFFAHVPECVDTGHVQLVHSAGQLASGGPSADC